MGQLGPKLALALASTLALALASSNNIVSVVVVGGSVVSYVVVVVVVAVAFVVRRQQSQSANSSRTCHTSKESAPHLRERDFNLVCSIASAFLWQAQLVKLPEWKATNV